MYSCSSREMHINGYIYPRGLLLVYIAIYLIISSSEAYMLLGTYALIEMFIFLLTFSCILGAFGNIL